MSKARIFHSLPALASLALGLIVLGTSPVAADGFAVSGQSAKGMGMAGAFVAQADDPSAVYYNIGALALGPDDKHFIGGATAHLRDSGLYQGLPPGIGANTSSEQEQGIEPRPHVYLALKLGPNTKLGFGLTSPFLLSTEWSSPGGFAGRAITTSAQLDAYDLIAGISQRLGSNFAIGLGLVYRGSELKHGRRLQRVVPGGGLVDVASIDVDTDFSDGLGWTVGLKHRPSHRFAWGLSYRSAIEIDYLGVGVLTQLATGNAQFDALQQAILPFGVDLATANTLEFPDVLTLGFAVALGRGWRFELDAQRTGWSRVEQWAIAFPTEPDLGIAIRQDFEDSNALRLGVQYTTAAGYALRAGIAREESPQPDRNVGPLLADADSTLFSLGLGKDWLDMAFTWIDYDRRIIFDQVDDLDGNYRSSAWMLALTFSN